MIDDGRGRPFSRYEIGVSLVSLVAVVAIASYASYRVFGWLIQ